MSQLSPSFCQIVNTIYKEDWRVATLSHSLQTTSDTACAQLLTPEIQQKNVDSMDSFIASSLAYLLGKFYTILLFCLTCLPVLNIFRIHEWLKKFCPCLNSRSTQVNVTHGEDSEYVTIVRKPLVKMICQFRHRPQIAFENHQQQSIWKQITSRRNCIWKSPMDCFRIT